MNLNKKHIILGFLILVSMFFPFYSTISLKFDNTGSITNTYDNALKSSQWVLSSPIIINETEPTQNWAFTAASEPWCTGSGILSDPYIIQDVTIDLQGANGICISIFDSNVYFQITDCTLINSGWAYLSAGIYLDNTNNGQLLNNNCSNHEYYGIYLKECDNNIISGNSASNNQNGIYLEHSHYNTITGNAPNSNSVNGIAITYSDNNTITGNVLSFNKGGISLSSTENCTVTGNHMSSCGISVYFSDSEIDEFVSNKIDDTNLVNGKSVYYYINRNNLGNTDFTNPGQIILVNCTDSFLSNFDITYTSRGIQVLFCDDITIYNSDFNNNRIGIGVSSSSFINITDNTASNNQAGISLYGSDNCTISGNVVNDNFDPINFWGYGINVGDCENCTVSDNTANNNYESGLQVWQSEELDIFGNTFNYNRYGIKIGDIVESKIEGNVINGAVSYVDNWDAGIFISSSPTKGSVNNTLKNNLMTNCGLFIDYGYDVKLEHITSNDIDDTNLVNGKPLYFYTNEMGLIPTDFSNAGQVFLINTNNSVIDNLLFSNTTIGIGLYYSNGNTISNCEFKHNKQNDFELIYSNNNEIVGNTFGDTNEHHLFSQWCNGNNITDNSITDDPVNNPRSGIVLSGCNNSYVLRNDISDCSSGIQASGEYNTFSGNNLSNNFDNGLSIYGYGHNTITNNTLNSNENGLNIESSDYNDILNNTMNNNRGYGVFLVESNYNTVSYNIFRCNRWGCWTDEGGTGNTFDNNICEECPEDGNGDGVPFIPGYNLPLMIGVISIISVILLRKRYKH